MKHHQHPDHVVSARVDALLTPAELENLKALQRLALSRSVTVAANGRWPHWTLERWLHVLTFLSVTLGAVFIWGGRWYRVETNAAQVETLRTTVSSLNETVKTLNLAVEKNHQDAETKFDHISDQLGTIETEARNAVRAAQSAAWQASGRGGRGGHQ